MRPRKPALLKELADDAKLLRQWRAWHREEREQALAGPARELVEQLLEILRSLSPQDGAAPLVAFIQSQNWNHLDQDVKFICLREIDTCITRLREKSGLPPFDDSLNEPPATAFLIIRKLIQFPA
jgi:hypothetical protein